MKLGSLAVVLTLAFSMALSSLLSAQSKPLTKDQVLNLVRNQLGDEAGARSVEQQGIDFQPSEDFLQSLKDVGANDAFLQALRSAKRPSAATAPDKKPLTQVKLLSLLAAEVPAQRVVMHIKERGIDFEPTEEYLQSFRAAGAKDLVLAALRQARVVRTPATAPTVQAQQAQVTQHLTRALEMTQRMSWAEAEQEYRAAVQLDPQNSELLVALGWVLNEQQKWEEAIPVNRQAVRLQPESSAAHVNLGNGLMWTGQAADAIAAYHQALTLEPENPYAHCNLGQALIMQGDLDGAVAESRTAIRLRPDVVACYITLGNALDAKGNIDEAIATFQQALRLKADNASLATLHSNLGNELYRKRQWDQAITEYRRAIGVQPDYVTAHYALGSALEANGERQAALEEYRVASELDPKNATYQAQYQRLLKELSY